MFKDPGEKLKKISMILIVVFIIAYGIIGFILLIKGKDDENNVMFFCGLFLIPLSFPLAYMTFLPLYCLASITSNIEKMANNNNSSYKPALRNVEKKSNVEPTNTTATTTTNEDVQDEEQFICNKCKQVKSVSVKYEVMIDGKWKTICPDCLEDYKERGKAVNIIKRPK